MHRPRGLEGEAGADEGGGQGVPGFHLFVGEHDGEHAVVTQDAGHLAEAGSHLALVVAGGQLLGFAWLAALERGRKRDGEGDAHALEACRVGHRLVILVGQRVTEEVRVEMAGAALEPDVEEIAQLGVHDVVVVGWVHADVMHRAGRHTLQVGSAALPDTQAVNSRG